MKYDFTSVPDRRGFGSTKWDAMPNASPDRVPLSVADMEFETAPEIKRALKNLTDKAILGYTAPTEEYYDAVCGWMEKRHNFKIQKEWIFTTPGVVNALGLLVEASTKPGEGVIIFTPVYYPFDMAVLAKDRKLVYSKLLINDGKYEIDYEDFAKKAADPNNTAVMFCNPHNPVGRVWTELELSRFSDICLENGLFIIDDEIHNDLIMPGYRHTVLATLSEKVLNSCAVCTAPSKSFNIAGLQCSNIIIANPKMRAKASACGLMAMQMGLNIYAYTACTAAYTKAAGWLDALIPVIADNARYVEEFMAENFPEIKVFPLEGTYLQWLDMRALGMTHRELRIMLEKAGLYLDNGELFGKAGRGFERINLACARSTLEKSMERFKNAVLEVRSEWEKNGKPYRKTLSRGDVLEGFVYDSPRGKQRKLSDTIRGTTLIVFLRYYECSICQAMLGVLKKIYPIASLLGFDIKAVMQSDAETLLAPQQKYPFELIADPAAELYDRYNVFEADGIVQMVAGDKMFEKMTKGSLRNLLDSDLMESLEKNAFGTDITAAGPRQMQVPAFIGVDKHMRVKYAHYSNTIADFPNIKEMLAALRS